MPRLKKSLRNRFVPHGSTNLTPEGERSPMASNYYGGAAVGFVAHEFLRRGANIAYPFIDCGYDLVVLPEGAIPQKIQVKSRWRLTNGNYSLNLVSSGGGSRGKGSNKCDKNYLPSTCDFIIVADMTHSRDCWVLPVSKARAKFRFEKNFYFNNWDLVLNK